MKVHELIERLLKLPGDLPVVCEFEACGDVSDVLRIPRGPEDNGGLHEARGNGYEDCVLIRGRV